MAAVASYLADTSALARMHRLRDLLIAAVAERESVMVLHYGIRMRVMSAGQRPLSLVILGYTRAVKTAISLPDDTYEQATKQAAKLGISRSEFFARAARSYLDELAAHSLTEQINEGLQAAAADDSNAAAATAGRSYLAGQDDW